MRGHDTRSVTRRLAMPPRRPPPRPFDPPSHRLRPAIEAPPDFSLDSSSTPPAGSAYALAAGRDPMGTTTKRMHWGSVEREALLRAADLGPFRERVLMDLTSVEEKIIALHRRVGVLERGSLADSEEGREVEVSNAAALAKLEARLDALQDRQDRTQGDVDVLQGKRRTSPAGTPKAGDSAVPKAIGTAIGGFLGPKVWQILIPIVTAAVGAAATKACEMPPQTVAVPPTRPVHSGAPP